MKSQIRLPKAILFDHDGVLVASEALHVKAWGMLLAELGLPYEPAAIHAQTGKTAPQILAGILNHYRPEWDPADYDLEALAVLKNDFYLDAARTELEPYPGVREGLAWMRSVGMAAAVVSNAKRRELAAALSRLGIDQYFAHVISRDEAGSPKPNPAPYLMGAALCGFEPSECLAVEDSPTGIEASLLAGIPSVAVLTNFPREALEYPVPGRPDLRPALIVSSMAELFEVLQKRH